MLIGGQLLVVTLVALDPTRGEVIQFHGLFGLAAEALMGRWALLAVLTGQRDPWIVVGIAISLAVGTLFVLLTGVE